MRAVSNSSPIMNLAAIARLDLIKYKFGDVIIPDAVWREVVIDGKGKRGAEDVEKSDWIKIQSVRDKALVKALEKDLEVVNPRQLHWRWRKMQRFCYSMINQQD